MLARLARDARMPNREGTAALSTLILGWRPSVLARARQQVEERCHPCADQHVLFLRPGGGTRDIP